MKNLTTILKHNMSLEDACLGIGNDLKQKSFALHTVEYDDGFDFETRQNGLLTTIEVVKQAIDGIHHIDTKENLLTLLSELETKITHQSKDGRYRRCEAILKSIKKANFNYVYKNCKNGQIYYPIIADMLFFTFEVMSLQKMFKKTFSNIIELLYVWQTNPSLLADNYSTALLLGALYESMVRVDQTANYTASLFSQKLGTDFANVRLLMRHLFFYDPQKTKNFKKTPMKLLPTPPTNPFKFSYAIAI